MCTQAWALDEAPAGAAPQASLSDEVPAHVLIGVNTDGYPYSFRDKDGTVRGFAIELTQAIGRTMNIQFEFAAAEAGEVTNAFLEGRTDAIQIFSRTPERAHLADFSVPYLRMIGSVIVRKDEKRIQSVEDLKGRKVLVHARSVGEAYLRRHGLNDEVMMVASVPDALRRLNAGEGDAALATRLTAMSLAQHLGLKNIEARGGSLEGFSADYCYAVQPGRKALLAKINEGLAVLHASGEFDRIYDRWFAQVESRGYSKTEIMGALLAGLVVALVVVLVSAIRRRRLVSELRIREELYRGVFDSAHEALFVLEPREADRTYLLVQQANAAAHRIFALPSPFPKGADLAMMICQDDDALCQKITEALEGKGPRVFEHDHSVPARPCWLMVSLAQAGARVLLVAADITEIKQTQAELQRNEQQLRQTQKLEAIGTLASGVAHDFNNILTGIMGNAELARMDVEDGTSPIGSIEQILVSADRARQLVRQILTFSRKSESRREPLCLTPIIEEALRFVRAASPSSITLRHVKAEGLPLVEADATQMHQIVMNLCTNSVHAMRGRNGLLEVVEEVFEVDSLSSGLSVAVPPGQYVRISVKDTGIGMPADVLSRIFDPFFTTKEPGEGTGLGLSVVHGIVRRHKGEITVYSQPGQGTVFHIYLPVAVGVVSSSGTEEGEETAFGNGEHIMVVDDEVVITNVASVMLHKLGYRVSVFNLPSEARDAFVLAPEKFDLVISDLTMPEMSGLDLAEKMRVLRPELPVLLMSGFIGETELPRIGRIGFSGVLDKPITVTQLAKRAKEALAAVRGARMAKA